MRSREFIVPCEAIAEFAEVMVQSELDNEIVGTTKNEGLIIEVSYVSAQEEDVDKLTDLLEDYMDSEDEDEDEEDEDE